MNDRGQRKCLHGQGTEDDEQDGEGKDGRDAGSKADDHRQDAEPGEGLASRDIYGKVMDANGRIERAVARWTAEAGGRRAGTEAYH